MGVTYRTKNRKPYFSARASFYFKDETNRNSKCPSTITPSFKWRLWGQHWLPVVVSLQRPQPRLPRLPTFQELKAVFTPTSTNATPASADRRSSATAQRHAAPEELLHFAYARRHGNGIVSTLYFRFLVGTNHSIMQSVGLSPAVGVFRPCHIVKLQNSGSGEWLAVRKQANDGG